MITPLKSVLVTDWSRQHIAGHNLDGGAFVSFNLDTTIVGTEALGHDFTQWNVGDIATLKIDAETQLAQLRIVTSKKYILRVNEFQIVDITHTTAEAQTDGKRHIFLKGTAENGATYVMPMLGYTVWEEAWDLTDLKDALDKAQSRQQHENHLSAQISYDIAINRIGLECADFKSHIDQYNKIFYSSSGDAGTVFDKAISFTATMMTVKQTGSPPRAQMFIAAYVKKTKESPFPGTYGYLQEKKGTAFSQPYFVIDDKRVFIRTSA